MRLSALLGLTMCMAAVVACSDEPTAPGEAALHPPADTVRSSAVSLPACTKHWAKSASGDWAVAGNWTPFGVPAAGSTVCLDAPGSYTVTMTGPKLVLAIIIGGPGVSATLSYGNNGVLAAWTVIAGIQVKSGSTLLWDDPADLVAGFIQVDGTWLADFPGKTGSLDSDSLVNNGTLELNRSVLVVGALNHVRNAGTIQVTGPAARLEVVCPSGSRMLMEGGTMLGQGIVQVALLVPPLAPPPVIFLPPVFEWTGGSVPAPALGTGPRLVLWGMQLLFGGGPLDGAVEFTPLDFTAFGWSYPNAITSVDGEIPSGVDLDVVGPGLVILPAVNRGVLSISASDTLVLEFADAAEELLINSGTVEIAAGSGVALLAVDSVVNSGTIQLSSPFSFPTARLFRNSGTITVADSLSLDLANADFYSETGGVQTGPLHLTGGLLSGVGQVGNVSTIGTQVEPGGVQLSPLGGGIGTLTAAGLILNPASSVGIDLAGIAAGKHDELVVTGLVSFAGTLSLREQLPFAGGSCGRVVPIVTHGSVLPIPGNFGLVTGLVPAPSRGWRLDYGTGALQLVGHDPSLAVSRAPPQLTATEGGPGASYSICLRGAPTASVTVIPTAAGGQLAGLGSLLFTPTVWALPKAVAVSAVNDLLYEPPPQLATITHTVASADPVYSGAKPGTVAVTIVDNDGSTNLELSVLNAPPVVAVGAQFTLSLKEFNLGPDVSVGATFTVPASSGYTYASSTGTLGCTTDAIVGTTCQLASLASGTNASFTVTFQAVTAGLFATSYSLTTIQTDPNLLNNTRAQTITIN